MDPVRNTPEKEILKRLMPVIIFVLFLIPVFTSSVLDIQQQKKNALLDQQFLAEKQAILDGNEKLYLLGRFDPSKNPDFDAVPAAYSISGYQMYLRKETLSAFENMSDAAAKDGVMLKLASATRNFIYQKNLWNKKWETFPEQGLAKFEKILEYSAAPGTSRHHWGTDIDMDDATPEFFNTAQGTKVYAWLTKNAPSFGFCQPYNLKNEGERENGYSEEKWHWSYLPLSKQFTQDYKRLITDADISGFEGDQYAQDLNLIPRYVLSINPDCI